MTGTPHRCTRTGAATSALDQVPEMSDESADVAEGAERAELRALLRSAVRGLGASEHDLIPGHNPSPSRSPSPPASSTTAPPSPPPSGTLQVAPRTIVASALSGAS